MTLANSFMIEIESEGCDHPLSTVNEKVIFDERPCEERRSFEVDRSCYESTEKASEETGSRVVGRTAKEVKEASSTSRFRTSHTDVLSESTSWISRPHKCYDVKSIVSSQHEVA